VRNSGWYIPFWRKPKRQGSDGSATDRTESKRRPRHRTDDELDRVRAEWVQRYTDRVKAFGVLNLSVGTPPEEIMAQYESLLADLMSEPADPDQEDRRRVLQDAYETLRPDG
jgi:hypothetical protein